MKSLLATAVILSVSAMVAICAPAPKEKKEDLAKKDLAKLEGDWKIVFFQRDGDEASAEQIAAMATLTFKESAFSFNSGITGKIISVDATVSPKIIDYKVEGVAEAIELQKGIYSIDGDDLMDCVSVGDKERPKEFTSEKGSGHVLIKYKRIKK